MRITKGCWFSLVIVLACASEASAAALEAYAKLPQFENVALSPDGTKVAFVTTIGNEREVIVQPLADKNGLIRLRAGAQKLRDLNWAGNEQLLVTVSQPLEFLSGSQAENFSVQNFDLHRKAAFDPMSWITDTWNLSMGEPIALVINGKPTLFIQSFTKPAIGHRFLIPTLYRIDLKDQTNVLIEGAPNLQTRKGYRWTLDAAGKVILQSVYDEEAKAWSLFAQRNGEWREIQSESSVFESPYVIALAPEDNTVIVKKYEDHAWNLRRLSLTDGEWGAVIPEKCCGSSYLIDPNTRQLLGYSWLDARRHYEFLDEKDNAEWNKVVQSFPGEEVRLESSSDDRTKIIIKVFGKTTGAAYMLVDRANQQMSRVGNLYAGIEAADIAAVKPISYAAADGMQITGYLTIPARKETKNLPLIVLPHGGPAARDRLEFEWMAQAFASRGYLVLQPNYRGSNGLGQKFEEAGYGEYGRKMQTDLSDGVRALVKVGVVDPKRVCIVGASYGGYAALAGATTGADVYRCAVSIAGVSDLKTHIELPISTSSYTESRSVRYWLRYLGASNIKDPVLAERSPAMHADGVVGPILLVHGTNDAVVAFEQSEIMAAALKKANKPYEFVKLKSEDHWLSKADTRLQMLQAVVKFLETNNPP